MTLRALQDKYHLKPACPAPDQPADTAIAFALDSGYLNPFKVMIASMVHTNTLQDAPVVIYSDDPNLFKDPIVKAVCDKPVLLEGRKKEIIYGLAKNNVERQDERSDWNRGTFLKWMIFEPQPRPQILFLDVDMICVDKLESLLQISPDVPFICAPQFQHYLMLLESKPRFEEFNALYDGDFREKHYWRVNSGVMVIREPLLSDAFFDELTTYASKRTLLHEQGHLSSYFKNRKELLKMVSPRYNCQERYLNRLEPDDMRDLLSRTAVIHFAGPRKPWIGVKARRRPGELRWREYASYAKPLLKKRASIGMKPKPKAPPRSKKESKPPSLLKRLRRFARRAAKRLGLLGA